MNKYPLDWPLQFKRTKLGNQVKSRFDQTPDSARKYLYDQLRLLGVTKIIVTSNVRLRLDGYAYATELNKRHVDPGVAIYFKYNGENLSMACDKWLFVWENMYAIGRTLNALRQIDRDGVSDFLKASFQGFTALPPSENEKPTWIKILRISNTDTLNIDVCRTAYRTLVKVFHPDTGHSPDTKQFQAVIEAWEAAQKHFNK